MPIIGKPIGVGSGQVAHHDLAHRTSVAGTSTIFFATVSTPRSAPVIAATRLRQGATNSVRGAAKLLADALAHRGPAGATGLVTVRADSAF